MNKTKKIAFAAVSFVMAGTLVGSMAACGQGSGNEKDVIEILEYAPGTTVNVALGYDGETTKIKFDTTTLPLVNPDGSAAGTSIKQKRRAVYRASGSDSVYRGAART